MTVCPVRTRATSVAASCITSAILTVPSCTSSGPKTPPILPSHAGGFAQVTPEVPTIRPHGLGGSGHAGLPAKSRQAGPAIHRRIGTRCAKRARSLDWLGGPSITQPLQSNWSLRCLRRIPPIECVTARSGPSGTSSRSCTATCSARSAIGCRKDAYPILTVRRPVAATRASRRAIERRVQPKPCRKTTVPSIRATVPRAALR